MANPAKIMQIVAITTYILPELRNASAISTDLSAWAKTPKLLSSNNNKKVNFFILIYGILLIFNYTDTEANSSYP